MKTSFLKNYFFILLHFFGVFGVDFFAKLLRFKMDKTYRCLADFFVLRSSREEKEHAVEQAIFSSRQYAGLTFFFHPGPLRPSTKTPRMHLVRVASGGVKMQKTYDCFALLR